MGKVVCSMGVSVDGYTAGPNQSLDLPFGEGGLRESLTRWMFDAAEDNAEEIAAITDAGATIMGRNMFGPPRGEPDQDWKGWWGPEPPYHNDVFVLTHHARESIPMAGGTTFHFVTSGIHEALKWAREAAGERNVAIAGGAATVNQYLAAGLIDELRLHIVPLTLGAGTRLFEGVPPLKLEQVRSRPASLVTHVTYRVLS